MNTLNIAELKNIDTFFQGVIAVLLFFYFIYAFMILRQTKLLNGGFNTDSAGFLRFVAVGHFVATTLLLVFTVVTLFI